ncbi:MAG: hypothetical protein E6J41_05005 [Chloroflexi bacterium]|nr:MAG: hypothetical protein E6J41_05005 [Chloroflexota bacterium]
MGAIFQGLVRRRTYVSAMFLATRLPLGFLYFVVLVIGLAGGLSGALVLVGIPAIVLTFVFAHGFAAFERQLSRACATILRTPSPGRASSTSSSSSRSACWRSCWRCSASASPWPRR